LIWIKAALGGLSIMLAVNGGSYPMATDMILVVLIAAAFGVFAATLYWADLQTRGLGK
jgi:hypothetical protein